MTKKSFRIGLDILMFVLLIVAINAHITSTLIHEIIGVALFALGCLHIGLNFSFYKNMLKGKYNLARTLWTILDLGLCVAFLVTTFSGIPLSKTLFTGLGLHDYASKGLHKIASYWWLILTGIHAGLHFVQLRLKLKNKSKTWFYTIGIIALIIIGFGIYYFITKNVGITLLGLGGPRAAGTQGGMMGTGGGHMHGGSGGGSAIGLLQFGLIGIGAMLLTSLILLVPRLIKK